MYFELRVLYFSKVQKYNKRRLLLGGGVFWIQACTFADIMWLFIIPIKLACSDIVLSLDQRCRLKLGTSALLWKPVQDSPLCIYSPLSCVPFYCSCNLWRDSWRGIYSVAQDVFQVLRSVWRGFQGPRNLPWISVTKEEAHDQQQASLSEGDDTITPLEIDTYEIGLKNSATLKIDKARKRREFIRALLMISDYFTIFVGIIVFAFVFVDDRILIASQMP